MLGTHSSLAFSDVGTMFWFGEGESPFTSDPTPHDMVLSECTLVPDSARVRDVEWANEVL